MTKRIAELRALRGVVRAYIDAYMASHASGYLAARDKAEARLAQEADKSLDALIDCAEALQSVLEILPVCPQNTGIVGIEARYNFAVVGAREALARLNGDDHAG